MKKFIVAVAVVILAAFAVPAFAATNPFMDVPASHWAYDAVAQLASRGVISGYPDGAYKGTRTATRYEMASVVARAMAKIDMEKASKQDVEMLKKLIVEFKDELDALGVKVDKIDSRLAVMEKDLGGWSLAGQFRFNAKFGADTTDNHHGVRGENDFDLNRYRIFLRKRINETTSFTARMGRSNRGQEGGGTVHWERYFVTMKLGYDIEMTAGRNYFEWEAELGYVTPGDFDPIVGGFASDMFWFKKDWGMANLQFIFGRVQDAGTVAGGGAWVREDLTQPTVANVEQFYVAGLVNFDITEKFRAGVMAYYFWADDEPAGEDWDLFTAGLYAGYAFTPSIELKGIYYYQSMGDDYAAGGDDDAAMWRIILDIDQDALKFTSLWLEYGNIDNHFVRMATNGYMGASGVGGNLFANRPSNDETTKFYGINTTQKWNDKWSTFARYYVADYDTSGIDDASMWGIGFNYQLNPAVAFQLGYDMIDYDNGGARTGDEGIVNFRTFVTF